MVGSTQKKVIEQLRLVFANQAEHRLEFINPSISDYQIKRICLGKITASDRDRDFGSYWQTCGSEPSRQIILIDQFVAEPAQLILALERMAQDKVVKLRKFVLCDRTRR